MQKSAGFLPQQKGVSLHPPSTTQHARHSQPDIAAAVQPVTLRAVQLMRYLQEPRLPSYVQQAILDLGYLCRTLWHLHYVLQEQSIRDDDVGLLSTYLSTVYRDLEHFGTSLGTAPTSKNFELMGSLLARHLTDINSVLYRVQFWVPPKAQITYYVRSMLVKRLQSPDRYEVGNDSVLENMNNISMPEWARQIPIFEHIGMKSGGTRYYDPFFFPRGPAEAREFFTPGRVFMILWSTTGYPSEAMAVVEAESIVSENRWNLMATEGSYTGPFEGPATVRRFVVVQTGLRSALCLPVISLSGFGCSKQPDQHNYGIVQRQDEDSTARPDERGMTRSTLLIHETPGREPPITKMVLGEIPPPSKLPNGELPRRARIDYRRWCEVELNVYSRNVGLVDANALLANVRMNG